MRYYATLALALLLPTVLHAEPAPLSYKDGAGKNQRVPMVVQPNADGTLPVASYIAADGKRYAPQVQAVICSEIDGAPQLCPASGSADLSLYLTIAAASQTYAKLAVSNSFLGEQDFAYAYFADPDPNVQRDAKFGDKGIAVSGGIKTDTLNATKSTNVPDTGKSDLTTAALNTESAAARFVSQATAASTYATLSALNTQVSNNAQTYQTITGMKSTLDAERGSVTGDISASGGSLTLTLGTSNLQLVMAYTSAGVGSLSAVATTDSLTPVDIYETAAWGTTSFKGFTLDSGTITTTATVVDSTFYLTSNAWGTYHVGVGGHLYVVDIFGAGAGKRVTMSWRKLS